MADPAEAASYMRGAEAYDVAFLSEGPAMIFMTTAALWITPRAARWPLQNTSGCVVTGVDHNLAAGCCYRCRQHSLRCRHAHKWNRSALGAHGLAWSQPSCPTSIVRIATVSAPAAGGLSAA